MLLYILVRAVLGIFVCITLSTAVYLISLPIVLSIWARTSIEFNIIGLITASSGATIGGYLVWLNRDRTASMQLAFFGLTVVCAVAGALIGSRLSGEPFSVVGLPGIPILVGLLMGATLGANFPHLVLAVVKAFMNPRL